MDFYCEEAFHCVKFLAQMLRLLFWRHWRSRNAVGNEEGVMKLESAIFFV